MKTINFKWILLLLVVSLLNFPACKMDDIEPEETFEFRSSSLDNPNHDNCAEKIKMLYDHYRPLAKKHCKIYSYCTSCYQDGNEVFASGVIKPTSCPLEAANTADHPDERSSTENTCEGDGIKARIRSAFCFRTGQTLSLYNPDYPYVDFFDSARFRIKWYKSGEVAGSGSMLPCIDNGIYLAYVFDTRSYKIVSIAFYTATDVKSDQKATRSR